MTRTAVTDADFYLTEGAPAEAIGHRGGGAPGDHGHPPG